MSRSHPAHQLEGTEVGRDVGEACHPGGHLAPRQEKALAATRVALQIDPNRQDDREVEGDDEEVYPMEQNDPATRRSGDDIGNRTQAARLIARLRG